MRALALLMVLLVGVSGSGLARVAWADDPDPHVLEEAAARYDRGVKLYEAGDYLAALAEFEAVYAMTSRYEVLFNIALTQKKLFRYGAAMRTFEQYLGDGGADVDAGRRQAVEKEVQEIHALVAEVTVKVEGAPAKIDVDGESEGATPLDRPLLLKSGKHTLRASREGELPDEKTIDVVSGQKVEVVLEPRPRPKEVKTARITIETTPPGAELAIDGKKVGPAPWSGELDAGGHRVTAEKKGYTKASQEVLVVAGQNRTVPVELVPLPVVVPPKPIYKKPWFWGVAGAVVVGAAVGAWYVATEPPSYDARVSFPP